MWITCSQMYLWKILLVFYDYISLNNLILTFPLIISKNLLLLCSDKVQFTFNSESFLQIDGVAMASPLGPLLADMFVVHISNTTENLSENIYLYKRYLDKILVICNKTEDRNCWLNKLNTPKLHQSFMWREEQLSFYPRYAYK